MTVAKKISEAMQRASWIRRMFEEGERLKKIHGSRAVMDFTLGNPNLEPPVEFTRVLQELAASDHPGRHGYMSNQGYLEAREAVAGFVGSEQGVAVTADNVIMTCGAGGGLNVVLKALLDPGDEVIVPSPYFVEYGFYADNHGGLLRAVPTTATFDLELEALSRAITARTKVLLINSPNNPTGRVYTRDAIAALGTMLLDRSRELGTTIYLVCDEPYRKIVYDEITVPSVFAVYPDSLIVTSYSKDLSLAGERIGFVAANPRSESVTELVEGLVFANRVLGFVNAPALMQRAVARLQGVHVDVSLYRRNRDALLGALREGGFEVVKPEGAFYLFPRSPVADDVSFARELLDHLVLVVPGSGFGAPGHFRMAYCVAPEVTDQALPIITEVGRRHTA